MHQNDKNTPHFSTFQNLQTYARVLGHSLPIVNLNEQFYDLQVGLLFLPGQASKRIVKEREPTVTTQTRNNFRGRRL